MQVELRIMQLEVRILRPFLPSSTASCEAFDALMCGKLMQSCNDVAMLVLFARFRLTALFLYQYVFHSSRNFLDS